MEQDILYNLEQQTSKETAYETLIRVISDLTVASAQSIDVAWASDNYTHNTTSYEINEKGSRYGEETLKIHEQTERETSDQYEIIPNPTRPPRIVYHYSDNTIGWDEALKMLIISDPNHEYT